VKYLYLKRFCKDLWRRMSSLDRDISLFKDNYAISILDLRRFLFFLKKRSLPNNIEIA